jgi:hypothetical protein
MTTIIASAHSIRHITIDPWGNIWDVVSMLDRCGHRTSDPTLASTCVVCWKGEYVPQDCDDVPIYTVH